MTDDPKTASFVELGLPTFLLEALAAVGYESPSPIQSETIPRMLKGEDIVGQAQTGTGKTAAFALPILAGIDVSQNTPQALVMVPTRELAIQVAEAFQKYAVRMPGFHVLPIYGGQSYTPQLKGLKRGAQVIVATPGRVMDHMKRGTLDLSTLRFVVLDEGDEMLQMGFVDDIEWILTQTPPGRKIALFSATMPAAIRRIAAKHMKNPVEITIRQQTSTAPLIRQRYWLVSGLHKLDALTRMLEAERFDAMLVFVRTKLETTELAEKLCARGFNAAELNGDIPQAQRERTIARLKNRQLDIVVATDVAARGIDVERISHVVNYDIPYDSETYTHRIGRTGRAGRTGDAILFVAPRERNMLRIIERHTRQPIEAMNLPTIKDVNDQRIARFKERIATALQNGEAKAFQPLLEQFETEQNVPAIEIAAALASLMQGSTPFLLENRPEPQAHNGADSERGHRDFEPRERSDRPERFARAERPERGARFEREREPAGRGRREAAPPLETFRIEVGNAHGALPGNIVGAIANEAGVDGRHIGHIDIRDDHSFVDLPVGMPDDIFQELQVVQIRGNPLRISRASKPPRGGAPIHRPLAEGPDGVRPDRPFRPAAHKPGGFGKSRKPVGPGGPRKPHRKTPKV
ncbi:MAG: DEAD/DEAH box helicase [Steroidobacteraceae bacterium]